MANLKSRSIYLALRERILSNDIEPGTRLVLRDVGNQYQASDIPVREALRMLERDGLVETAPYVGARVTTLTAKEVEETYFIRSHLESIATGLAADRITEDELAELDVLMAKMDAAVEAQDGPALLRPQPGVPPHDHRELRQRHAARAGDGHLAAPLRLPARVPEVPDRLAMSQREHEGIMAALRDHDSEGRRGSRCCTSARSATRSARSSTRVPPRTGATGRRPAPRGRRRSRAR